MSEEITILISPDPHPKPSILRVPSTSRISSSSSPSPPSNISFAPLPKVEGKRRRNRRPIGLAGRAELLQVSRQRLAEAVANEDNYYSAEYSSYNEEEEIPLPDIGKLMKGLWRSISRVSIRDKQNNTRSNPESESAQIDNLIEPGLDVDTDTGTGTDGNVSEDRPNTTDPAEVSISPLSRETTASEPQTSTVVEDVPQIQISAISTAPSKDLDVLPKGIDDLIQVSVFNALKVQNP